MEYLDASESGLVGLGIGLIRVEIPSGLGRQLRVRAQKLP